MKAKKILLLCLVPISFNLQKIDGQVSNTSTTFDPGDLAIIGVNTTWTNAPALPASNNSRADEISFVVFKDVQPGTLFYMTDNGYGRNTPNTFGVTEGLISFTRTGSVLPAGSIITIRGNGGTAADGGVGSNFDNRSFEIRECGIVDTNWIVAVNLLGNNIIGFDLNPTDQVWFMQGGTWSKSGTSASDSATYSNGTVLYGWSGISWKTSVGATSTPAWTTSGSMLYPKTACFLNTLSATSGVNKVKYTGAGLSSNFTPTTKLGWIARINNAANWSAYQSTGGMNVSYDNYNSNLLYQAASTPNTDYGGYTSSPVCSFSITANTAIDGNWNGSVSTDWFDCNNWDTKIVPDAVTDVSIGATASNNCIVNKTSASAYLYNNTADCLGLKITNKSLSTGSINDIINVNGNFTMQSNAVLDMTNGGTFNLNGSWTDSNSTFISGTGSIIYGSAGMQTVAAENYNNLISASTGNRILSSSGTIGIKSMFVPNYPGQIYTVANSTIDFNGVNTNQNIPAFAFYNIGLKNGGTKTFVSDDTVYKTLTLGNNPVTGDGTVLALNNTNITLHSDSNSTANIASIATTGSLPCSINYGVSGRFVIERYLPMSVYYTSRRWRLLTAPVSSINAPTINAAWQEGAINTNKSIPIDPNPGHGTTITYNTTSTNGYDQGSTNSPSIYYMIPGFASWAAPLATNSGKITDNQGYMLFARGDRSIVVSNQYINTTGGTTLRVKGQINTGDINLPLVSGKQILGNPYPSAISFNGVNYNGVTPGTTIGSTYYLWDPKLLGSNTVGAWAAFSSNGDNTYTIVPNPAGTNYMSQYANNGIIESGDAFIVNANQAGSFIIHETDKLNTSSTTGIASRPANNPDIETLYTNLSYTNANGETILADGVAALYGNEYHDNVDSQDVQKLQSFAGRERLGILSNANLLSIERRQSLNELDTIHLMDVVPANSGYQLQFVSNNLNALLQPVLEDRFTKASTNINTNGITQYNFTTTSDTISTATNRFEIVFKKASTLPLTYITLKSWRDNNNINIQWKVANETDIKTYTVEKSIDGIHFTKIAFVPVVGMHLAAVQYNSTDTSTITGDCYYRISGTVSNGVLIYSPTVKVEYENTNASISIVPNPIVNGTIRLQFNNMEQGKYNIRLLNSLGQLLSQREITHKAGYTTEIVQMGKFLSKGMYQLEIVKPDDSKVCLTLLNEN
jgi:hypothetical protein